MPYVTYSVYQLFNKYVLCTKYFAFVVCKFIQIDFKLYQHNRNDICVLAMKFSKYDTIRTVRT